MEILKTILYILILAVLALLAYAAMRPNTFRLERSTVIKAPPEKVFGLIQDFKQWTGWSPWENVDADLKRTYSGTPSGVGTIYEWLGKKTGQGRMEITEANPGKRVSLKLDFIKPFKASNITDFDLTPTGWRHEGQLGHARPARPDAAGHAYFLQHGEDGGAGF